MKYWSGIDFLCLFVAILSSLNEDEIILKYYDYISY